jgi:hypothetical protein
MRLAQLLVTQLLAKLLAQLLLAAADKPWDGGVRDPPFL